MCFPSSYLESGKESTSPLASIMNLNNRSCVLSSIFNLTYPLNEYDFKINYPDELNYPSFIDIVKFYDSRPNSKDIKLDKFSLKTGVDTSVRVLASYNYRDSAFEFLKSLDCAMCGEDDLLLCEYPVFNIGQVLLEEFNDKMNESIESDFCFYDQDFAGYLEYLSTSSDRVLWPECFLQNEIVPTFGVELSSLGKGVLGSMYGAYHFATISHENIDRILNRWMMDIAILGTNFNIHTLILTFVKLLNELIELPNLLLVIYEMFKKALKTFDLGKLGIGSTQPYSEIQPTLIENGVVENLMKYEPSLPAVASAFSAIAVICGSLLIGKESFDNHRSSSLADKTAHAMAAIAKGKAGIYACLAMVQDFKNFIYNIVIDLMSGSSDDILLRLISSTTILDFAGNEGDSASSCEKYKLFEYVDYLLDDNKRLYVCSSDGWKGRLDFCIKILYEINQNIAKGNYGNVPSQTTHFVTNTLKDLRRVKVQVARNPNPSPHRFTPFWINIAGKSGLGKSQVSTLMFEYLYDVLKQIPKFQVPEKSQFAYSINFADKYLTNYKKQYLVYMDDFAQDNNLIEVSSDLFMINAVSNVPYSTIQAAIEDKGIQFESKIVLSTSNDTSLRNRKLIVDVEALKRRMQCYAELIFDETYDEEPLMDNKRVKFHVKDRMSNITSKVLNAKEFIEHAIVEYNKWFDKEMKIASNKRSDTELVNKIVEHINEIKPTAGPFEVLYGSLRRTGESISNKWNKTICKMGLTPICKQKIHDVEIEQFMCDCMYHYDWNTQYSHYCITNNITDISLLEFCQRRNEITSFSQRIKEKVLGITKKVVELMKSPLALVMLGAGAALAAYLVTKKLNHKSNDDSDDDDEIQQSAAQYQLSKPRRAKFHKVNIVATDGPMQPITRADSVASDLIQNILFKRGNLCVIEYGGKGACATRIRGSVFLANHHFMCFMNEGDIFTVHIPNVTGVTEVKQNFETASMYRIPDTDLVLYKCDRALQSCKDITKHFLTESLVCKKYQAAIVTAFKGHHISDNLIATPNTHADGSKHNYHSLDMAHCYDVVDTWTVSTTLAPIQCGMSGSLLIATESNMKQKIIGVQLALNTVHGKAYFKPVTIDMLEKGLEHLKVLDELAPPTEEILSSCGVIENFERCPPNLGYASLNYLGEIPKSKTLKVSTKSKIIPSLIQDVDKLTQLPSVLSDKDSRMNVELFGKSVIFRAMEGFDRPIGCVKRPLLRKALSDLSEEYRVKLSHYTNQRQLLNDYEVVNGVPSLINRVEMKSSPGYPYILNRKDTNSIGKYEWFEEITPIGAHTIAYQMKEVLACGMKQREEQAKKGIRTPTIAYACLKDETRPLSKIQEGATRAFICLPLDYNLLIRKYFGAFIAMQHYKAGEISSCVGIDPAKQWKEVYDRLMSKNPLWEDFDYKNWDQSLHPELVMSIATLVNEWYGDSDESENGTVRRVLLSELVHTHIIIKNRMFQKSSGQCSGCAITAELNCLVHELLVYYIWLDIHEKQNLETNLADFRENVCIMLYGDDIIKSVRDTCSIQFNGDTIKPYVTQLGMNITPGNKTDTMFSLKKPEDITFLKRSFVKDGDFIKAPLRSDIVYNITQWIHKSDDSYEATKINCETALQESYMHGRSYYSELQRDINNRIIKFNSSRPDADMRPVVLNYELFDGKYRGNEYTCVGVTTDSSVG